jgi:ribosomal protein L13
MGNFKRPKNKAKPNKESEQEENAARLMAFEKFEREIAPELREMLAKGASSKEMMKKFAPYAAARGISIALMEPDSSKAITMIKDIMDRTEGRATEVRKVEHSLKDMDDRELDALLRSEEADLAQMDSGEDDDGSGSMQ